MATTQELAKKIGRLGEVHEGGFTVPVTVQDAKVAYGGVRLLVTPLIGNGMQWVEERRVRLLTETEERRVRDSLASYLDGVTT